MGLSKKTGIDLPNEVTGSCRQKSGRWKTFRQKWYAGEVISVGIGQGAVAVSRSSWRAQWRNSHGRDFLPAACCQS